MIAYYLKEDLKEIWNHCSKQKAKSVLDEWVKQAIESQIQPLMKMASTIRAILCGNKIPFVTSQHRIVG